VNHEWNPRGSIALDGLALENGEAIVLADLPDFREDVESVGRQTNPELVLEAIRGG
jgi:hypothetical protein